MAKIHPCNLRFKWETAVGVYEIRRLIPRVFNSSLSVKKVLDRSLLKRECCGCTVHRMLVSERRWFMFSKKKKCFNRWEVTWCVNVLKMQMAKLLT